MNTIFWLLLILGVVILYLGIKKQRLILTYTKFAGTQEISFNPKESTLSPLQRLQFLHLFYSPNTGVNKKYLAILLCSILATLTLNHIFLQFTPILMLFVGGGLGIYLANLLRHKEVMRDFESNFPELLVTLNGAISAGGNITQALNECSNSINGVLKQELKLIVKSLEIGDDPSKVFLSSYKRLPFKNYYFFLTAILVSLKSGARLKEILSRLSIANTKAKAIEKKKNAMTSEARMSSKITACIPFFFLFVMKFISPENFDFIMHNQSGRYILYYFLGSEFIGIMIIMFLMRKI